ncbi:MAG: glucose-6-phosphate isomerase [Nitrospirota bacterium]
MEMYISIDFNNMMEEKIGRKHGIGDDEIDSFADQCKRIHNDILSKRSKGELPFLDLPYQDIKGIMSLSDEITSEFDNLLVLGIGGSALGPIALISALCHPFHNMLSRERRMGHSRVFVYDNVDPDAFLGLLEVIDLSRTAVNVVTKSGNTVETLAAFLIIRERLRETVGKRYQRHIIVTTDPEKGSLRKIAEDEGYRTLSIPEKVVGRFSVLTPVGLFPASVAGIDIEELLNGAALMDKRCQELEAWRNPAQMTALLQYVTERKKGKKVTVMMPYSAALKDIADWFRQLWAESLGKRYDLSGKEVYTGQTTVKGLGVTDQHSQLQLYMEGPNDKTIVFLKVERFTEPMEIPVAFQDMNDVSYICGHSLSELINAEQRATEIALTKVKRPNMRIDMPELSPFTVGQLLYMLEVQTIYAGGLYNINPFDQPGVEEGKKLTWGIMHRPGFEDKRQEVEDARKGNKKYII